MRFFCFLGIYLLIINPLWTQILITKQNVPKSVLNLYEKGVKHYQANEFIDAIQYFEKALKKSPTFIDAALQMASVCFDMENYSCAEIHFENVLKMDSNYNQKIYYTLALSQYKLDHFKNAKENMRLFLNLETTNQDLLKKAKDLLPKIEFADSATQHAVNIDPSLIRSLQTEFSEYLPSITADGKTVVFTRRTYQNDEDLYISFLNNNEWSQAIPILDLNTPLNEGSPAISPDGKTLVFTSCDRKNSYGGCDLYISKWQDDQWSEPVNMGDKINSAAYESQACFAENGQMIYFTSNRKGTLGGRDIWYSKRKQDHSWTIAKNLGSEINTIGNEDCPFVHPNEMVLYFSSDFPPGMGGKDLFYSLQNEKGHWQTPMNLGYPINTKGDESSFIVFPDGVQAWYASDRQHYQNKRIALRYNLDLYALYLPSELQIKPATSIEISIRDKITKELVSADIRIFDLSNNKIYFEKNAVLTERILISLPTGVDYGLHIYNKDYLFVPDQFNCSKPNKKYNPLVIEKWMEKISLESAVPITLKNIFFESGSAILKEESYFELKQLLQFLKDHTIVSLLVTGYTDNIGSETDNIVLSEKRALSVIAYLIRSGIQAERLNFKGKGESEPIDNNDTEEGRTNNRRIEFLIQSK
ncbi:MAG: PD40 domain-containing protein [Saprospiraceae bacterium]|nr:PD40 domain-containing protein [Saprospiraceae bacterium]